MFNIWPTCSRRGWILGLAAKSASTPTRYCRAIMVAVSPAFTNDFAGRRSSPSGIKRVRLTRKKSQGTIEAIAAGHTCEELLTRDRTLTDHDISHAVTEAPNEFLEEARGQPGTGLLTTRQFSLSACATAN